jgi:hypothetical protein
MVETGDEYRAGVQAERRSEYGPENISCEIKYTVDLSIHATPESDRAPRISGAKQVELVETHLAAIVEGIQPL